MRAKITLTAKNWALLNSIVTDYERCAPDVDGHTEPWRSDSIRKAQRLLTRWRSELTKHTANPLPR